MKSNKYERIGILKRKGVYRTMIKKLVKPEIIETDDEKVVPFAEDTCYGHIDRYYADEEIDDITF